MEEKTYYSNGKLLLTGEYLVLKGAGAIALPVKFGQSLQLNSGYKAGKLLWQAYAQKTCWLEIEFMLPSFEIESGRQADEAKKLRAVLLYLQQQTNLFNDPHTGYKITTQTNFPRNWGLGTSSTHYNNLANLFQVNPYQLLNEFSKGSGYDIACAYSQQPVLYKKMPEADPFVENLQLNYPFLDNLFFVYLGKKQQSEMEVKRFLTSGKAYKKEINTLEELTEQFIITENFYEFCELCLVHEEIISSVIKLSSINKRFNDFQGVVKSLGAWGGDFILAASDQGKEYVKDYFREYQMNEVFAYKEMVLK